ncbi:MAG: LysE/ArgO family amino acid transporter [Arenicella sp.]
MLEIFIKGFFLGLSLIVAIGAQNAFVLKQGLKGQHVFWVCLVCATSDAALIAIGVFSLSLVEQYVPQFATYAKYFGAIFLLVYGLRSFISAFGKQESLQPDQRRGQSLWKTLLVCLALTWLNPHVYLDTVVLLGSIAAQYGENAKYFGYGAVTASFAFFFTLGYGASWLRPWFDKPMTWKLLDIIIGIIMWAIAYSLLV